MAEGADRYQWNYTATVLAMMVNSNPHRKKGSPAAKPADFHPYESGNSARGGTRLTKGNIGILRKYAAKP